MPAIPPSVLFFVYATFVVYGSLVPFDFQPRPVSDAWQAFINAPWLSIGPAGRADWVANLLLYIPLGALSVAITRSRLATLTALFVSAALALAIEFAQLYVPARTVSLNDLIAELLGVAIGLIAWLSLCPFLPRLVRVANRTSGLALWAYTLIYIGYSVFPLDMVLNHAELRAHLASDLVGWFIAPSSCRSTSLCLFKIAGEVIAVVPIGLLVSKLFRRKSYGRVALAGLTFSALIELAQLFLLSGVSQGASLLTRAVGFLVGAAIGYGHATKTLNRTTRYWPLLALPYLAALAYLNGWTESAWLSYREAIPRIADVKLPFYYHYYASETRAMLSLAVTTAFYAPAGALVAAWTRGSRGVWLAGALGLVLATLMETGKLFVPVENADPTHLILGAIGAALGWWFTRLILAAGTPQDNVLAQKAARARAPLNPEPPAERNPIAAKGSSAMFIFFGVLALTAAAIIWWTFPIARVPLAIFLILYAGVLWRISHAWLWVVPGVLPWLDLAPWSGRLLFDEFDMVVLVTLGIGYMRFRAGPPRFSRTAKVLIATTLLSYVASLLLVLYPIKSFDANALGHYHSPYFALRLAKGFLFACALLPLLSYSIRNRGEIARHFSIGMSIGLIGVAISVLWERLVFVGLTNFTTDFRVTGPFSTMNTGGAHLDGYLALALPFAAFAALAGRSIGVRLLAISAFMLSTYALLVTFSRGAVIGFVGAVTLWAAAVIVNSKRWRSAMLGIFMLAATLFVVTSFSQGSYFAARWAKWESDVASRFDHWRAAAKTLPDGVVHTLFGAGLARFPENYYWAHIDQPLGNFRIESEGDSRYLRLLGGRALYFEQRVALEPNAVYVLNFRARAPAGATELAIPICEKSMLYSFGCRWLWFKIPSGNAWQEFTQAFDTRNLQQGNALTRRPVKLSLYLAASQIYVDVDNISLVDAAGAERIANGTFEHGLDHWHFATDDHLPWHIKNLAIGVFYDQGWIGLLVFVAMLAYLLYLLLPRTLRGDRSAVTLLAGLVGFMIVGLFDSLFDAPRLMLVFYLSAFVAIAMYSLARERKAGGPWQTS